MSRGKVVCTTIRDAKLPRPLDKVNRVFKAERPNQFWVLVFTCVSTWLGWLYVAFLIYVNARRIVGWRVNNSMHTKLVLDALEQALYASHADKTSELLVLSSIRNAALGSMMNRVAVTGYREVIGSIDSPAVT